MTQNHPLSLQAPRGLEQIVKVFGEIDPYINRSADGKPILSPEFERRYITRLELPIEITLAIQTTQKIKSIRCHRLLRGIFARAFDEIVANDWAPHIHTIDGCFVFRPKRSGSGLSVHSWGIAIDLNALTNLRGTKGNISSEIVAVFKNLGFTWGGDWRGKNRDPMHFQFCSGY